jgi:cytochrome P450
MLVGPDLYEQWATLASEYLPASSKAGRNIRFYPSFLRWTAKYVDPSIKALYRKRIEAGALLQPVLEARLAELNSGLKKKHEDAIQWVIEEHRAKGHTVTADELAQSLLALIIAATHQTTMTATWLLFDLIEHPDSLAEIRQEIGNVHSKLNGGSWTRIKLGELRIMDSFMTETMRYHSSTQSKDCCFLYISSPLGDPVT